uniref:Uncharacterized protein n=1 Tax=Oryza sativa subsp. japonica TaxID=39947 RepID=Q69XW7_ORYSJ|nr:hypothetical protein [Oryza sativa Japonica Group]
MDSNGYNSMTRNNGGNDVPPCRQVAAGDQTMSLSAGRSSSLQNDWYSMASPPSLLTSTRTTTSNDGAMLKTSIGRHGEPHPARAAPRHARGRGAARCERIQPRDHAACRLPCREPRAARARRGSPWQRGGVMLEQRRQVEALGQGDQVEPRADLGWHCHVCTGVGTRSAMMGRRTGAVFQNHGVSKRPGMVMRVPGLGSSSILMSFCRSAGCRTSPDLPSRGPVALRSGGSVDHALRHRRSSPAPPPTCTVRCPGRGEREGKGKKKKREREEERSVADMWGHMGPTILKLFFYS